MAIGLVADIEAEVLDARHLEIPFVERLLVHGADAGEALLAEVAREVAADESAAAGDDDQVISLDRGPLLNQSFRFHIKFCCVAGAASRTHP